MAETTVKGFFESLESRLNSDPSKLAGMNAVYQFRVGEESYCVSMKEGKASVASGRLPARTAPSRWRKMTSSRCSPES